MYIKVDENNSIIKYPYSILDLKKEYPNVSFPLNPTEELFNSYGVFSLIEEDQPSVNYGEIAEKDKDPKLTEHGWVLGWTIREMTEYELIKLDEKIQKEYTNYIQNYLDEKAQQRGYDGILSLCSYVNSTNPTFAEEAQIGIQWRDNIWTEASKILDEIKNGQRPIPDSIDDFMVLLPKLHWPDQINYIEI